MEVVRSIVIESPVDEVWDVVGESYGDACKWASRLRHSSITNDNKKVGVGTIRKCDTADGVFMERINLYDEAYYVLAFNIIEGLPSFVTKGGTSMKLSPIDDQTTSISMKLEMIHTGAKGYLLSPLTKWQASRLTSEVLEELKYYVEKGEPHPRKIKSDKLYALHKDTSELQNV